MLLLGEFLDEAVENFPVPGASLSGLLLFHELGGV